MRSSACQESTQVLFVIRFWPVLPPILKKQKFGFVWITETAKSGSRTMELSHAWLMLFHCYRILKFEDLVDLKILSIIFFVFNNMSARAEVNNKMAEKPFSIQMFTSDYLTVFKNMTIILVESWNNFGCFRSEKSTICQRNISPLVPWVCARGECNSDRVV